MQHGEEICRPFIFHPSDFCIPLPRPPFILSDIMDALDHQLARLHRHRRTMRTLAAVAPAIALGVGAAATVVMVVRLAVPGADWLALPFAAAGALVPLALIPRAWRQRDDPALLAGHLDDACDARGLAMALASEPAAARDADWAARLRRPLDTLVLPPLPWRAARMVPFAAVMLTIAMMLPQVEVDFSLPPVVATLFQRAEERVAELAPVVPEAQREEAERTVEQLKNRAEHEGMDQATWEGLDRVHRDLDQAAGVSVLRLAQALAAAENAASDRPSPGQPGAGAERLAQAVAELAAQAPGLMPRLPAGAEVDALAKALQAAAGNGALSPEQLAAVQKLGLLRAAAKQPGQLDSKQLQELAKRLGDELSKCKGGLGKLGLGDELENQLRRQRGGQPGVDRGPGHAPLTWDDPLRTQGGGIQGLPAGAQLNPDGSVTIAEQIRDADLDEAALQSASRAAARAFDPAAADARRATVAPRHRAAVEKYFAAPDAAKP